MGMFEERLLGELVQRHGVAMSEFVRRAPRPTRVRPLLVTAGALTVAGSIAIAVTVFDGNTPAYAVSKNADGTVTLSISDIRAVDAANAELRRIGAPVVAVPMTADCKDTFEIDERFAGESSGTVSSVGGGEGSVTVQTKGVRPGSMILVAAKKDGDVLTLSEGIAVQGKVPSCLPDLPEGSGDSGGPGGPVATVEPVSPTKAGR
ncbi:hypothetical protein [Virgisporangium aurantiacum]|uniref:Uncharacterized protein n=1 Tax=Virgisporangium aurantiacum TaxID=175570 RepID=A0A8J3ZLD9_9ACTN|nr:hypothetical protein [Virgisporangium aurantiacum]GIJ63623.1 hypothetical protein Vau01_111390 [Virgisporangium aurantiacum]